MFSLHNCKLSKGACSFTHNMHLIIISISFLSQSWLTFLGIMNKGACVTAFTSSAPLTWQWQVMSVKNTLHKAFSSSNAQAPTSKKIRKPRGYWTVENLEKEIQLFWEGFNITSNMVPNEGLLSFFQRHDLRYAIGRYGGQRSVGTFLNTSYMPGAWRAAIKTQELQHLVDNGYIQTGDAVGPRGGATPMIKKAQKARKAREREDILANTESLQPLVSFGKDRKKKSLYWTSARSFRDELYAFTKSYMQQTGQPPTWMPRLVHFRIHGREDLVGAISRYGGYEAVADRYGLVPYKEWIHFEKTYTIVRDLLDYLQHYHNTTEYLPTQKVMKENGAEDLNYRLMVYGGRKVTARRFGLKLTGKSASYNDFVNFGNFSIEFALELLEHIKSVYYKTPIGSLYMDILGEYSLIKIPSAEELQEAGREDLIEKIEEYGGFENVARRLRLHYDEEFLNEETEMLKQYLDDDDFDDFDEYE